MPKNFYLKLFFEKVSILTAVRYYHRNKWNTDSLFTTGAIKNGVCLHLCCSSALVAAVFLSVIKKSSKHNRRCSKRTRFAQIFKCGLKFQTTIKPQTVTLRSQTALESHSNLVTIPVLSICTFGLFIDQILLFQPIIIRQQHFPTHILLVFQICHTYSISVVLPMKRDLVSAIINSEMVKFFKKKSKPKGTKMIEL